MKRWRIIAAGFAGVAAVFTIAGAGWVYSLGPPPLGKNLETSQIVLDHDGRLLRAYATAEAGTQCTTQNDEGKTSPTEQRSLADLSTTEGCRLLGVQHWESDRFRRDTWREVRGPDLAVPVPLAAIRLRIPPGWTTHYVSF